jgi:hypothetical protein
MAYGTIKVDTITFTDAGVDKSVTISGLVQNPTFSGNITVTGTVSGNTIQGQTVSGATITGGAAAFTTVTGGVATITSGVFALGSASNPSISFNGDANSGLYSPGADQVAVSTGGTGRLFVDASGNVGVGTSSVNALLEVNNSTAGGEVQRIEGNYDGSGSVILTNWRRAGGSVAAALKYNDDSSPLCMSIGTTTSHEFRIRTADTDAITIDASQRVGIGTSSPAKLLHVSGDAETAIIRIANTTFGNTSFDATAAGLELLAGDSNTSVKYMPAIKFGSTDSSFTTTNPKFGAALTAEVAQDYVGDTTGGMHLAFWTAPINPGTGNGLVERLRIDSAGNVGIGTTSPVYAFVVSAAGASGIEFGPAYSGTANLIQHYSRSGFVYVDAVNDAAQHRFQISGTERARIDSSGRLLVGTSSTRTWGGVTGQFLFEGTGFSTSPFFISNSNDQYGCFLTLGKSRGTSVGSNTVVQSGDYLGEISFVGADGSVLRQGAGIAAWVDGTPGANDMPGRLIFATTADGAASPTERMRITSGGNVGIGTTSPGAPLEVIGTAGTISARATTGVSSQTLQIYNNGTDSYIDSTAYGAGSGGGIVFRRNGSGEMGRWDTSGRLLVGTSTSRVVTAGTSGGWEPRLQVTKTGVNAANIAAYSFSTYAVDLGGGLGIGPDIVLARSNSDTEGTQTAIANNMLLGRITFNGSDGTAFQSGAFIAAASDGQTWASGDCPTRLVFSTTADGASSPTERLRIDSSGRVGVGTTSPGAPLDVSGLIRANDSSSDGNAGLVIATDSTARGYIGTAYLLNGGSETDIGYRVESGNNHIWMTGATERARIDNSGRLLVGTSSSAAGGSRLQIEGTGYYESSASFRRNSNDASAPALRLNKSRGTSTGSYTAVQNGDVLGLVQFSGSDGTDDETGAQIACEVDGTPGANDMPGRLVFSTTADGASTPTERMRISQNGQVQVSNALDSFLIVSTASAGTSNYLLAGNNNAATAIFIYSNGNIQNTNNSYGAISDIKLKENIVDASSQWDDLKALQVRNYNFKEGQTHTQIGLVAQEVELVSPGLVSESPDRDEDGNDLGTVTKSVNYSVLYMKAVKALQEAMERIETLEGMVAVNNITIDEQQHQLSTLAARLTTLESA